MPILDAFPDLNGPRYSGPQVASDVVKIKQVIGREILDSRGNPTVEAEIVLDTGHSGRAAVPSGASRGTHEAIELRDDDQHRYLGKGVLNAVRHINTTIAQSFANRDFADQAMLDQHLIALDGSPNKARLGANATLAVSLAFAYANAQRLGMRLFQSCADPSSPARLLPIPMMNILNGGAHANNSVDIQEFMIMPIGAPTFREALRYGAEIFHTLKKNLNQKHFNTAVGDEGGFAPDLSSNQQALDLLMEAITDAGFTPGKEIAIALDMASSEFYRDGQYHLSSEKKSFNNEKWCDFIMQWLRDYPILSVEDAMAENDWQGWQRLTSRCGQQTQLVGDDLFVTNTQFLQRGIEQKAANAILIKLNQIGTLTETLAAIRLAKENNYGVIISHRSGETEDCTIADLAVATNAGQIKTGSLCRSDRVAKYNQLLRIEEWLGAQAIYAGQQLFRKV